MNENPYLSNDEVRKEYEKRFADQPVAETITRRVREVKEGKVLVENNLKLF